jgi:two-component system, NtrC family, response regulator HydG
MTHALVVDDDSSFALGLAKLIGCDGLSARIAGSLEEARAELAANPFDVVLVDLKLPDGSGMDLLADKDGTAFPDVVLVTGNATVETAVEALRLGASDYLVKPVDLARLKAVLAGLARTREAKPEATAARRRKAGSRERCGLLVGNAAAMERLFELIGKAAPTDATVLVLGETGSGKELVARAIHELSGRRRRAFHAINCGAVSPNLMESELFGHERGSFTGADRVHRGIFERADKGTLFLDEITEMRIELQVKLLRVLESRELTRVGGSQPIPVDVRVIAASNRPPSEAIAAGKLREDLFYRLNVLPVPVPPLRERLEDVETLANHFLDELNRQEGSSKRFSTGAMEPLRRHRWPGNVRELKNVVHRAFILAAGDEVCFDVVPLGKTDGSPASELPVTVGTSVADAERRLILATLEGLGGDKKKAAEVLKMSLKTLYNRLAMYKA